MTILVANQWTALREGIATNEDGSQYFTGKIVVTFFLDKVCQSHSTGVKRVLTVDNNLDGKAKLVKEKDKNGKDVTKLQKTIYEHQAVLDKVSKSTGGFNGWAFKLNSADTVCLPKGRSESREETVTLDVSKDLKNTEGIKNAKTKTVQVKTQPEALLEKIFTVKGNGVNATQTKTGPSSTDLLLQKILANK